MLCFSHARYLGSRMRFRQYVNALFRYSAKLPSIISRPFDFSTAKCATICSNLNGDLRRIPISEKNSTALASAYQTFLYGMEIYRLNCELCTFRCPSPPEVFLFSDSLPLCQRVIVGARIDRH